MLTGIPDVTFDVPPPRHTRGRVLYLDIDGVLHPGNVHCRWGEGPSLHDAPGHKLFEHAQLLDEILHPYSTLRIVLSSSWVRLCKGSLGRIGSYFTPGLRARIVGSTYHSRMLASDPYFRSSRGMQIWSDVVRRRPIDWIAVDDDYMGWPKWCVDRLVRTDDVLGISDSRVLSELREKLEAMYAGIK